MKLDYTALIKAVYCYLGGVYFYQNINVSALITDEVVLKKLNVVI